MARWRSTWSRSCRSHLPVLIGHGPVVDTLAALGRATDFAVTVLAPEVVERELTQLPLGPRAVSGRRHARRRRRGRARTSARGERDVRQSRRQPQASADRDREPQARSVPEDLIGRLKAPAGLDIGAVTPEEIAVSIVAEVVQFRRGPSRRARRRTRVASPRSPREQGSRVRHARRFAAARHRTEAWAARCTSAAPGARPPSSATPVDPPRLNRRRSRSRSARKTRSGRGGRSTRDPGQRARGGGSGRPRGWTPRRNGTGQAVPLVRGLVRVIQDHSWSTFLASGIRRASWS